ALEMKANALENLARTHTPHVSQADPRQLRLLRGRHGDANQVDPERLRARKIRNRRGVMMRRRASNNVSDYNSTVLVGERAPVRGYSSRVGAGYVGYRGLSRSGCWMLYSPQCLEKDVIGVYHKVKPNRS